MVYTCAVAGCDRIYDKKNNSEHPFYQLPKDLERRKRWIAAIGGKNWKPRGSTRLCSAHFISGRPSNNPNSPDYIPTIIGCEQNNKQRRFRPRHQGEQRNDTPQEDTDGFIFFELTLDTLQNDRNCNTRSIGVQSDYPYEFNPETSSEQ